MKRLVILILLCTLLCAENNNTAPCGETFENAKIVAINGWDSAGDTLKEFILTDGEKFIVAFLKVATKPYEINSSSQDFPIPQLNVTSNDIYYALAYAKYLESQSKVDEALGIYTTTIKGLSDSRSDGIDMIRLIYTIVIEDKVARSLIQSVEKNIYNAKQKKRLYDFLKDKLLLNEKLFRMTMDTERTHQYQSCINSNIVDTKYFDITNTGDTDNAKLTTHYICNKLDEKNRSFYEKINSLSSKEESDKLFNTVASDEAEFIKTIPPKLIEYLNGVLEVPDKPFLLTPDTVVDLFFYVGLPRTGQLKLDFLQRIEENRGLLESLHDE